MSNIRKNIHQKKLFHLEKEFKKFFKFKEFKYWFEKMVKMNHKSDLFYKKFKEYSSFSIIDIELITIFLYLNKYFFVIKNKSKEDIDIALLNYLYVFWLIKRIFLNAYSNQILLNVAGMSYIMSKHFQEDLIISGSKIDENFIDKVKNLKEKHLTIRKNILKQQWKKKFSWIIRKSILKLKFSASLKS